MGLVLVLLLGSSAPAGALSFSVTVDGYTTYCHAAESTTPNTARLTNTNCNRVRAILHYRDSGGTPRLADGGWKAYVSTAEASTIMVLDRSGQGEIMVKGSAWKSGFQAF